MSSSATNSGGYSAATVHLNLLRKAFAAYDTGMGELPLRHIRAALQQMAIFPTEETLFELVSKYHRPGKDGRVLAGLSFESFQLLVQALRSNQDARPASDAAIVEAFVALGGNKDRSGQVSTELLRHVVREEFALPIDIDRLIQEADLDGGGFIDFDEFSVMLRQQDRPWLPPGSKATKKK
jgi:calmodulin